MQAQASTPYKHTITMPNDHIVLYIGIAFGVLVFAFLLFHVFWGLSEHRWIARRNEGREGSELVERGRESVDTLPRYEGPPVYESA
jgi:hypothetical protein